MPKFYTKKQFINFWVVLLSEFDIQIKIQRKIFCYLSKVEYIYNEKNYQVDKMLKKMIYFLTYFYLLLFYFIKKAFL